MDYVYDYLQKLGYNNISKTYYNTIENWINIWKGKAKWLDVKKIDGSSYPMYSLGMAKRVSEDLASTITSEPFIIKAKKNDNLLQDLLKNTKLLNNLSEQIEKMAYSGTLGTVVHIKNATIVGEGENAYLSNNDKTKKKLIHLKGNQIIPLTIEDDEIIECAFVSEKTKKINNKITKVIYLEIHELKDRGYQITNKFFNKDDGEELRIEGIIDTYNTLSKQPLFSLCKLPKVNIYDNNNGLGMALFGDSIDQLQLLDLTYNNFGMDFKLGQKVLVINKKLTRMETEEYTDKDGSIKTRHKIIYPSDIQKQQFMEVTNGIMGTSDGKEQPYIFEYNPDLRVGDNTGGIQFALDCLSFKCNYGTHYYSFDNGNITTATEAVLSRSDFVSNGNKVRKVVNEYLKSVCRSLLLCEKILGNASIDEFQDIEIEEVDGFLEDDNTIRERARQDVMDGLMSKKKYLMKIYKMTEKEANQELLDIEKENSVENIDLENEYGG